MIISEVGPRDGLQNEPEVLAPDVRAELVSRLARTGVPRIELGSFVSASKVPQMADPERVDELAEVPATTARAALVLNERGYDRLAATGVERVHVAFCVTETFNRRNQGRAVDESVEETNRVVRRAHADGRPAAVTLAASFGCPFEGEVDPGRVLDLATRVAEADEVVFADTIGVGSPRQVTRLVAGARPLGRPIGLHLHNTRNTGYANAYAAIEAGATVLDSSVAGLGGCPFAPAATGNVATEDLVYLLEREGVPTGVDLDAVIEVARWVTSVLGRDLPGQLLRAGRFPGDLVG